MSWGCSATTIKPRRSRPSETCPPLKEIPDRVPAAGDIFFLFHIKINDFLYEICYFHCFYPYIFVKILRFTWIIYKSIKNLKNLENFGEKILRIFWSKNFSKKIFLTKNRKKCKKNSSKYRCDISFRSEFNFERCEIHKY